MDAKYFKDQICDELNGAQCYIEKAIELKPMAPNWSKKLVEMSASELQHAGYLHDMFMEYYKKMSEAYKRIPKYVQDAYDDVIKMYDSSVSYVKELHTIYNQ